MRRRYRLTVEPLEVKALLSGIATSLLTDRAVYEAGQPIRFTFTETNTSDQPVTIEDGPSLDGFTVTQNDSPVWRSNAGINPMYVVAETLQPGQSRTLTATWNGTPAGGSAQATGAFAVSNQLDPAGSVARFQIVAASNRQPSPSPGEAAPGSLSPQASPPGVATLTTNRPSFRRGQPVHITLTLTNQGGTAVRPTPGPRSASITIMQGSTVVWRSAGGHTAFRLRSSRPGQGLAFVAIWNGRPNQPGVGPLGTGTYTILAQVGTDSTSAAITLR
jgi:hypothetical protein